MGVRDENMRLISDIKSLKEKVDKLKEKRTPPQLPPKKGKRKKSK